LPQIEDTGATLVAISPMLSRYAGPLVSKLGLKYPVLSDPGFSYLDQLRVMFDLPAELIEIYRGFGIDLERFNGEKHWRLPLVGRIVVDTDGVIQDAAFFADHTERVEPEVSVALLRGL
jgi:peroxiredoxin